MIKECEYIIYKKMQMTNIPMKMEAAMQNFFTKKFKSWNTSEVGDDMENLELPYTVNQSVRLFNILEACGQGKWVEVKEDKEGINGDGK